MLHASGAQRRPNAQEHRATCPHVWAASPAVVELDAEAGMLSGVSRKRSVRSSSCWFTEFCNSQCLSHFAAPFIVVRAETSVAESCMMRRVANHSRRNTCPERRGGGTNNSARKQEGWCQDTHPALPPLSQCAATSHPRAKPHATVSQQ